MDKGGVAVGLATISVVGAALLFSAEHVRTGPMNFVKRHLSISPDGGDTANAKLAGLWVERSVNGNTNAVYAISDKPMTMEKRIPERPRWWRPDCVDFDRV
jgi:hypothetical protein